MRLCRLSAALVHVALMVAFVAVFAAQFLVLPAALLAAEPRADVLQILGTAYAKDARISFVGVDVNETVEVGPDAATWAERLQDALAVGYSPEVGEFHVIPLAKSKDVIKITMPGDRTPEETVRNVVRSDRVVLHVTWHFSGVNAVKTYVVFSPDNALLFDTMMFLPVLRGPLFAAHR